MRVFLLAVVAALAACAAGGADPEVDAGPSPFPVERGSAPPPPQDTARQLGLNKSLTWKQACSKLGMNPITVTGEQKQGSPGRLAVGGVGGAQIADVSVDIETGIVKMNEFVAVQDQGLVLNPKTCESQILGAVIMGVAYALYEEKIMDPVTGRTLNPDMEFYKLGGLRDMPKITVHMMDMPDRGVVGIGEPPTISTAAAVGNAVFNAIGVRVPMLPVTPKRVLDALGKGGKA